MVPDTNHGEGSRVANQDRTIEDQQLPAQNAPTLTPGHKGGSASECGRLQLLGLCLFSVPVAPQERGHTYGGSAEARSEKLGRSTPELLSALWDPDSRNQKEHEDGESGVQQPSETAPERPLGSGQDRGDANDLVQSRESRGRS